MMTRTTLKALWFGGGGILATWLAVTPNAGVPATSPTPAVGSEASSNTPDALNAVAARLRERSSAATLRPSTRNPFRFSSPKPKAPSTVPRAPAVQAGTEPTVLGAPPTPVLRLAGVALESGQRTAIIAGDGEIYVVGEGGSVAGRYIVVRVDPEAVLLRDAGGGERRLLLPQ